MKKYEIKHLSVKPLSEAAKETTAELDGVIRALRGTYPPPPPPPPLDPRKTYVTYSNGDVIEYEIEGELNSEHIANIENAKKIAIGTYITSFTTKAFYGTNSLIEVSVPSTITSINYKTFSACLNLSSILLTNGLKTIDTQAFWNDSNLKSIEIPSTVTYIANSAFDECAGISSIIIDPQNSVYDSRSNCNAIIRTADNELIFGCKNTIIPDSVTSIGDYAFDFAGLSSITIPTSVTSIGFYAFGHCFSLSSITIPTSVTEIGDMAFDYCPATVTFEGKDKATVQRMTYFRWNIGTNKIVCTDGTL